MQRLSGVMLLLAGAALGGYAYLPPPQNDAEKLAEVTRISAAPDRDLRAAATAERVFAPAAPQQGLKATVPAQPPVAAAPVAVAVATPVEVPVQSAQPSATAWTAVVKSEEDGTTVVRTSSSTTVSRKKPALKIIAPHKDWKAMYDGIKAMRQRTTG